MSIDDLGQALRRAGDEDDRWEAKGGEARPQHVERAAAGMANRDGGFVVLGAERTGDARALTGLQPPRDDEPGTGRHAYCGRGSAPVRWPGRGKSKAFSA